MEKDKKQMLYNMYNATSTDDGTGSDELETYENWLERQLLSRIKKIEQLNLHNVSDSLQADIRNKLSPLSNLIAMIESDADIEWIKKQIPQAKISIEYLSNYR